MADQHQNQAVPVFPLAKNNSSVAVLNGQIFVSASRAQASYNSDAHFNYFARGIRLFVTNDGAGGSTSTVKIQVRTPVTGAWTDLAGAVTAALGAVTGSILTVYPGITATANVYVDQHLGLVWRAVLTVGVATGTQSVEADYLL